jgi:hypothetical protein
VRWLVAAYVVLLSLGALAGGAIVGFFIAIQVRERRLALGTHQHHPYDAADRHDDPTDQLATEATAKHQGKLRSSSRIWIRSLKSRLDSGSSCPRLFQPRRLFRSLEPPVPVGPFSHLPLRSGGRQNRCSWAHSSQSYTLKVKRPKGWGGFLMKTSGGQLRG